MKKGIALTTVMTIAVLQVADVITTNYNLVTGTSVEANPIILLFMDHLGALWWLPKAAVMLAIGVFAASLNKVANSMLILMTAVLMTYCGIVANNVFNMY